MIPRRCRHLVLGAALACMAAPAAIAQEGPGAGYAHIPAGAYSVFAEVRAKPGREAELRAVTLPLIDVVRRQRGNLVYFLQEDREARGRFLFYEVFASLDDFEAHNASPEVQAWFRRLPELAEGGVRATRMEILSAPAR